MQASEAVVLSLTANNFVEFQQYFNDITLSKFPLVSGLFVKFLDKCEELPEITIDTKRNIDEYEKLLLSEVHLKLPDRPTDATDILKVEIWKENYRDSAKKRRKALEDLSEIYNLILEKYMTAESQAEVTGHANFATV